MPESSSLEGKVAYITGAARGQGRAHCVRLARAGASIVAIDACGPVGTFIGYPPASVDDLAETVRLVSDEGAEIYADRVDVRDLAGQQRVIASAIEQFGRLDVVVANAGVMGWARAWEMSAEQWQEMIDINLTGFWNTIRAAVIAMIDAGNGGSIIAISSAAGIKAVPGAGHYSASKFGIVGLTNSLAIELGEYEIRVNSVHTYGVDTAIGNDASLYTTFEKHPRYAYSFSPGALPTESLTAPEEVSEIVLFLASDASALMTGTQVLADKGYLKI